MNSKSNGSYEELNYFNAVCCLLVVLIHTLSLGITGLIRSSWQFAAIYFPWNLSAFVVPAFLFNGAVKMALQFKASPSAPYPKYIWRRIKKIYVPYIAWVIVYYIIFIPMGIAQLSVKAFLYYIVSGKLASHFYYIIITMQFYLLMPLWRWVVKHIPWYLAVTVSIFVTLLMLKFTSVLQHAGITFNYSDRVFPTYLFFWILGLYVGSNYETIRNSIVRNKIYVLTSGIMILVYSFISYIQYTRSVYIYDMGYLKIFSDTLWILLLLCLSSLLAGSGLVRLRRVLHWIHGSSFQVYLSHVLFITVGTYLLQSHGVTETALLLVLRAILGYGCPFALYFILKKIRLCFKR